MSIFKEEELAIQINAPKEHQFVKILGLAGGNNIHHKHLSDGMTGIVDARYIRKCTKKEVMLAKIKHGL